MSTTTFSGPVRSLAGFISPPTTTAALPAPASVPVGTTMMISDNGVGNNEFCVVINTGTAWVTSTGQPLT